ncbi:MAG: hypothetical protein ABR584_06070 [Candidatus Baltobacteraceae bacterium]
MPSNFELSCKNARELIPVPAIPLEVIRSGAQHRKAAAPKRRYGLPAATLVGLTIVAAAAATELLGVRISFNPSGPLMVYAMDWKAVPKPTRADFQNAVGEVNFPVLLPVGLPPGTIPIVLNRTENSAVFITYNLPGEWRRSNHVLTVVLANPKAVTTDNSPPRLHMPMQLEMGGPGGVLWHVRGEDVIVLNSTMTASELAHFKTAMLAAAAANAGNASTIAAVPASNPADAASMPRGTRVSFERDGTLRLSSDGVGEDSLVDPTDAAMRHSAAHASFPVILPAGMPFGTKARNFTRGQHAVLIFYDLPGAWRRSDHLLKVLLIDPKVIVATDSGWDHAKYGVRFRGARDATRWTVGHEQVIFLRSTMTPAEMAKVKNAMTAAAARQP